MIAPCPLLFPRRNVMVGHMYGACLVLVIVAPKKVAARARNHITRRHGNIRVPAQIIRRIRTIRNKAPRLLLLWDAVYCAFAIVDTVVFALAQWKLGDGALRMIGNETYIAREERLVFFMDARCDVRPP